jgi:DNA-binding response OmpR family regulator
MVESENPMSHADGAFLEDAKEILNRDGGVFLAFDAQQAFQLAKHFDFCVALVDLDQQGQDALPMIQRVRQSLPEIPVIAISSVLGVP